MRHVALFVFSLAMLVATTAQAQSRSDARGDPGDLCTREERERLGDACLQPMQERLQREADERAYTEALAEQLALSNSAVDQARASWEANASGDEAAEQYEAELQRYNALRAQLEGQLAPSRTTREFASPETFLGPTSTAFVVLVEGQTERNDAFCRGYLDLRTPEQEVARSQFASTATPTRWLIRSDMITAEQVDSCAEILQLYHFQRATTMRSELVQQPSLASAVEGNGPFIVQIFPDGSILVFSASRLGLQGVSDFASTWLQSTASGRIARPNVAPVVADTPGGDGGPSRPTPPAEARGCEGSNGWATLACRLISQLPMGDVVVGAGRTAHTLLCPPDDDREACEWFRAENASAPGEG